jgi:RNA recognition motif-containing protein
MSNKLFVGGLAWATDDQSLGDAFSAHGEVTEARVISDRETGRSRGFGFVTFADASAASAAIDAMNGQNLDGRTIRVNFAEDKPRRDNRGGGNRGGGGGGGGGRW